MTIRTCPPVSNGRRGWVGDLGGGPAVGPSSKIGSSLVCPSQGQFFFDSRNPAWVFFFVCLVWSGPGFDFVWVWAAAPRAGPSPVPPQKSDPVWSRPIVV